MAATMLVPTDERELLLRVVTVALDMYVGGDGPTPDLTERMCEALAALPLEIVEECLGDMEEEDL